jgi:hypothetical protein
LLDSSAPASGATPVGERHPQIRAKGLSGVTVPRELTYAAPTADGDAGVDVRRERVEEADGAAATGGRPAKQANTPRRNTPRQGAKRSKNKKKRR